jgi:hypothetical protein
MVGIGILTQRGILKKFYPLDGKLIAEFPGPKLLMLQ